MKTIAMPVGLLALAGTIVPPILFMLNKMPEGIMQGTMLGACLVWFITAPMWIKSE